MVKMSEVASPSDSTSNLPHLQALGSSGEHSELERHSPDSASDFSVISNSGSQSPGTTAEQVVNGMTTSVDIAQFQDMNFLLNSAVPDMSLEQMENAFANLLRENLQLKDDVLKSNVAMREQFELMVKLQVHVEEFQKEQVAKHERARVVIEQLREENAKFRENQAATGATATTASPVVDDLKCELAEIKSKCERYEEEIEHQNIVNHQLKEEMAPLRNDFLQLKSNYARLLDEKRELMEMNAELQSRQLALSRQRSPEEFYDASDNAPEVSQGFLMVPSNQAGNSDMTLVEEKTIKNLLAQLNEEQVKNKDLLTELAKHKDASKTLTCQIEGQEEVIRRLVNDGPVAMQQQGVLLMTELKDSEHKFSLANNYLQKYRDHCDSLENVLGAYQLRLQDMQTLSATGNQTGNAVDCLRSEIATLQATLSEEKSKSAEEKKTLLDAQHKFNVLFDNHKKLEDNWASFMREQISRGRQSEAYYNLQEKYYQEKVDVLMAKLVTIEDKLASKEQELSKVHPEITKLKQEAEAIPILQTQVDLYKTDFRAERDAREKMHEEKERICEEMRILQTRYREAMETIAQLRSYAQPSPSLAESVGHGRRHSHGRSHRMRTSRSPTSCEQQETPTNAPLRDQPSEPQKWDQGPESPFGAHSRLPPQAEARFDHRPPPVVVSEYVCPKCGMNFDLYAPLEKHVNACLDKADPFM